MMSMAAVQNSFGTWFSRLVAVRPGRNATQTLDAATLQRFQLAVHGACRRFVQRYPQWTARGFDEHFLRSEAHGLLLRAWLAAEADAGRPTGMDLARLWDRRCGAAKTPATRVEHLVQVSAAADELVRWLRAAQC